MEQFLKNLEASGLLTARQWSEVRRRLDRHKPSADQSGANSGGSVRIRPRWANAGELAAWLVKREFITPWQSEMLLAGKQAFFLGKYRLLDCIGSGGMGAVFKALQPELQRTVAIKVLSAQVMRDPLAVARFRQEIQLVAALNDPHIVAAFDAGFDKKCHFLVMEYVDGHDLGYYVRQYGRLPINWACECIRQAALGLQHAGEQGLAHRDIKPTNLLITTDNEGRLQTKILDLGLARFIEELAPDDSGRIQLLSSDGSLTQVGQILGTPDYIAPEQARHTSAADIRSDIFSLGCTLFRLLTGELPFPGHSVLEKLEARQNHPALPLAGFRPDAPPELARVLARMLERDPARRYQLPREVAAALLPFCRGPVGLPPEPLPPEVAAAAVPAADSGGDSRLEQILLTLASEAASPPRAGATSRGRWRPPMRVWLGLGLATVAVCAGVLLWQRAQEVRLMVNWPLDEREGATLTVNERPQPLSADRQIVVARRAGRCELTLHREGFEPVTDVRVLVPGERSESVPQWQPTAAARCEAALARLKSRAARGTEDDVGTDEAAAARREIGMFIREHAGSPAAQSAAGLLSGLRWPLDVLNRTSSPAADVLPDLAAGGDIRKPELVSIRGSGERKFWGRITAVATSPEGRWLAGASTDGTVQVFEAAGGRRVATLEPGLIPVELAFSPQGDVLALAGAEAPVILWNWQTSEGVRKLDGIAAPIAFSGDGRQLAGRASRQEVAVWDLVSGQFLRTLQGHVAGALRGMTFSHNGRMLAASGIDGFTMLWDVGSGQERRRFSGAQWPKFSLDDSYLATGTVNSDLVLWDTRTGESQRTFDDGGYPLEFLPNGRWLASRRLGRVILWDLESGEELRTLNEVPELAAVSPDGRWLAGGEVAINELRIWSLESPAAPRIVATSGDVTAVAWMGDSQGVVTGSQTGVLETWRPENGQARLASEPPCEAADLSPDGRWLAIRCAERVVIVDVMTGNEERLLSEDAASLEALRFSPEGASLLGYGGHGGWGGFRRGLLAWDPRTGQETLRGINVSSAVKTVDFSNNSRWLALVEQGRQVSVWDLRDESRVVDFDDFPDRVADMAFHPDGQRLAVACVGGQVLVCHVDPARKVKWNTASPVCRALAFSPDGRWLALATGGQIAVWDFDRKKLKARLDAAGDQIGTLAWHPQDGSLVAAGERGCVWWWRHPADGGKLADGRVVLGPGRGLIRRVWWSPEGRYLLTANGNGTVTVLRVAP